MCAMGHMRSNYVRPLHFSLRALQFVMRRSIFSKTHQEGYKTFIYLFFILESNSKPSYAIAFLLAVMSLRTEWSDNSF